MRSALPAGLALALVIPAGAARAQAVNPEDEPIVDQPVAPKAQPAAPAPVTPPTPPAAVPPATQVAPPPTAPVQPTAAGDTVTVPRAVWEQLLKDVQDLKRSRDQQAAQIAQVQQAPAPTPATEAPPPVDTTSPSGDSGASAPANRNYLLLPDISFIANGVGLASSDKHAENRNSLDLEGELAIQGYVYPGVKYDTFITGNPGADEAFQVEEGYLTFQNAMKGLDINVGRKFAAFGRTGDQHSHSWLYSEQLLPRRALIAPEALSGNGVQFNYLIPTPKSFFARASLGVFGNGEQEDVRVNTFNPSGPFEGGNDTLPGASLSRFYSGRLWLGKSFGDNTEVEFGASAARGRSMATNVVDDGTGNPTDVLSNGRVNLTGLDFSARRFVGSNGRLLFRTEYFHYDPQDLPTASASGYYGLLNWRPTKYYDWGLLYEHSGLPTAPGQHESGVSLIYTKRLTEQYYIRLTGTHGDRPDANNFNELRLQFVAGLGPHTHNLE